MATEVLNDLENLKSDKALLIESLISAVKLTFVERFPEGFDRPCNEDDFSNNKQTNELYITSLKLIIANLAESSCNGSETNECYLSCLIRENELLASVLVMCGENAVIQPWNNEVIVQNCQFILSTILDIFNCHDVSKFISNHCKENLIPKVLNLLSPNLLRSTWKCYPASVASFKWFLFMITQPILSSYLQSVLPPSLLLVDDFVSENKIIGVECLNHIVQNMATAELQFYGHGDVIYNAVLPVLRIREGSIIKPTIPLMLLVTTKLEHDFRNQSKIKWSKFDNILEILLENMELEQAVELRNSYISHLALVIDSLKHRIIRWSKRLLRIFEEYISTSANYNDEKSMNLSVKAVEKYLNHSKEVIPLFGKKLLYILLVGLIFSYNSSSEIQIETKEKLISCVKLIFKFISKPSFEEFQIELYENFKNDKKFLKFFDEFRTVIEENNESIRVS